MRPYRGKRKDNWQWVYGWYCKVKTVKCFDKFRHFIIPDSTIVAMEHTIGDLHETITGFIEVHPKTVGQQVGLKDKHGKEAYADDRIDTPRFDSPFVIKWDGFNAKYYMQSEQNNHIIDMRYLPEEGEIIGNIYSEQKDAN